MNGKLAILGTGKLGLCLGLNLERSGFHVDCYDINKQYIKLLKEKKFISSEPGVNDYLKHSRDINFTDDLTIALNNEIIYVVVNTPSTKDHKYDHTNINNLFDSIKQHGPRDFRTDIVLNCTTFPGYIDSIQEEMNKYNIFVSYNPEFIAQGTILSDQVNADLVVIGAYDKIAEEKIKHINLMLCKGSPAVNVMSNIEAELTKLSLNCFLTTKISYANMIGDIALRYNANPDNILSAIGSDSRVGPKYLKYGYGYGGPCFPRDNRALAKCAEEVGVDAIISKATDQMNSAHLEYQIDQFVKNNSKDVPVIFDYVTYKKESVILEESQQLEFARRLKNLGYKIIINDKRSEVTSQLKDILE